MSSNKKPEVGIIMGSDSDLETMNAAAEVLKEFDVAYEVRIISAHRTPDEMVSYARTARERGLKVIIAGAGGAAHLPGMTAALTDLPVVGVPVPLKRLVLSQSNNETLSSKKIRISNLVKDSSRNYSAETAFRMSTLVARHAGHAPANTPIKALSPTIATRLVAPTAN